MSERKPRQAVWCPKPSKGDRRWFLKLATLSTTAALLEACGISVDYILTPQAPVPGIDPTPSPTCNQRTDLHIIEDEPSASNQLTATAEAALAENRLDTFSSTPEQEAEGFTRELFEAVQKSTFAINMNNGRISASATGWLAGSKDNDLYIVTNQHFTKYFQNGQDINFSIFQPNIGSKGIVQATEVSWVEHEERDLAIIRGTFPTVAGEFQVLEWEDDYPLQIEQNIMTIGYPSPFREAMGEGQWLVAGDVNPIFTQRSNQLEFIFLGETFRKASGSPVIIPVNGKPLAVGIITLKRRDLYPNKDCTARQIQNSVVGEVLDLQPLMSKIMR
jgi:hypothetical protein